MKRIIPTRLLIIIPLTNRIPFKHDPGHARRTRTMGITRLITACSLAACLLLSVSTGDAQTSASDGLKPGHPERYVVREGDTLWSIASKFLDSPWRWEEVWTTNPGIEDPYLIYPGDLLVITDKRKIKAIRSVQAVETGAVAESGETAATPTKKTPQITVKLQPQVHATPIERAIPTIPPQAISPFLSSSGIIDPGELDHLGYVLSGIEDELILGKLTQIYARGLSGQADQEYLILRTGQPLIHPQTRELLGVEAIHLGRARINTRSEDVSRLAITSSNQAIFPADRLLPVVGEMPLPHFQPRSPESDISGLILHSHFGTSEVGKFDIVIITGGAREGIREGHVFKTLTDHGFRIDPVTGESYPVPDSQSGLIMVFQVFEKLSYALIMESNRQIVLGDRYVSP